MENYRHTAPRRGEPWVHFAGNYLIPLDRLDPLENSQRAPMIVKTQYTGPFFPENGHGNLWLTMDILRNPKNPKNEESSDSEESSDTIDIHG